MLNSHSLFSRKSPLHSVWVAAYYIKELKKSQIFETDISSSVDKILQDEFEALTYRVLAYLLLGVVRIYSKKVEYLYDDCNVVLVQIKDFVVKKKYKAQLEIPSAPYFLITVPERFELDAFDLEILEDTNEKNVRSQEEITLKDVIWDSQGSGQFYPDKYHFEDFGASCSTCPIDFSKTEDEFELQFMDIDTEEGTTLDLDKLDEIIEKLQCDGSSKEASLYCGTIFVPEKELPVPVNSHGQSHHTENEQEEAAEVALMENHVSREADSNKFDGQDEHVNLHREDEVSREAYSNEFDGPEERVNLHSEDGEPLLPREPCGEYRAHEENLEKINGPNTQPVESMMRPIEADNNVSISEFEANTEKLQDDRLPHVDLQQPSEFVKPIDSDDQPDVEEKILPEVTCSKKRKRKVIEDHPLSVTVNATPRTKLSDASDSGTTPKFMLLPTPANKEHARLSRKRRCLFDDMIVYPNSVFKQWINDPSDLVRTRKKGVHSSWAARTKHSTANLVHDFCKPLVSCPLELIPLHYGKILKVQKFVEIAKTPEKIEVSAPVKLPGNVEVPEPIVLPENLEVPAPTRSAENLELSIPAVGRSSDQRDIAPQTPVRCSTTLRSFAGLKRSNGDMEEEEPLDAEVYAESTGKNDKEPATSQSVEASTSTHPIEEKDTSVSKDREVNSPRKDEKEPATSLSIEVSTHQNAEIDSSVSKDQEANSPGKNEKEPSTSIGVEACAHSFGNEEKDSSVSKDQEVDLNFMSKDVFYCYSNIQGQVTDGWSERTRLVAKLLRKSFLDKKNRGEEEKVKLLSMVRGKTKKESARLFYEILVLKTKDFVEVEQDNGFGDILISKKAPLCDQTYSAFAM